MPEMQLRTSGVTCSRLELFIKNKERIQKFKEVGDQDMIIKTDYIKLSFNMTWLMEIFRIYLEEQLLRKYYVIKQLILLKLFW